MARQNGSTAPRPPPQPQLCCQQGRRQESCRAQPSPVFVWKIFIHIYQTQGLGRQQVKVAWHNTALRAARQMKRECAPARIWESNYSCPGWGCTAQLCSPLMNCRRTRVGKALLTAGNSGGSAPPSNGVSMGPSPPAGCGAPPATQELSLSQATSPQGVQHDRGGQELRPPFLLQLDTQPKGRVGSSPRELCALAAQEFGHCPSQGASLGWLCEGRAGAGVHGESQAGLDMSTHQRSRGDRQGWDI